ncbi:DUF2514 family protein [Paraburkholderia caballeronis]|uniref:DUF2514 domain-containing protein n=1 Tax=Paraburkholderia caballeronis TaxID=416943 RepID=A0A1H7L4L6_9BURK|nr:DUF2514 family protein [Paraburkholderia caballeronis]PXW28267.1 uncharacterized protein DUF2514 [Paraburkholderia caballeronis]PXX03633.1 uncharacterized protein DUF2514 [Paraburkholderia caballeronis]RAK04377.1 uncharacterized protein DUF2514 [Paraburkholderia caballeronis]SED82672.1 Protein of unknown function [Paraburkholderia caballeronis]SEK93217.1 Protein of unknown function [Paraburkholderia caballeronis]
MNGYWITGLAAAVLGLALGAGGAYVWEDRALLAEQAAHAHDRELDAAAQTRAVEAARAEEQRRTAAQSEIAKDANAQRTAALADAFAARAAAGGLQQRVTQLIAAARTAGHSATAAGSPATGDALDLLADVLGRADDRAGELAAYADAARIAGEQCERDYDALTAANTVEAAPSPDRGARD